MDLKYKKKVRVAKLELFTKSRASIVWFAIRSVGVGPVEQTKQSTVGNIPANVHVKRTAVHAHAHSPRSHVDGLTTTRHKDRQTDRQTIDSRWTCPFRITATPMSLMLTARQRQRPEQPRIQTHDETLSTGRHPRRHHRRRGCPH